MLEIKPIQTKAEQERDAAMCSIPYRPDAMAYGAREDGKLLGVCQFRILAGYAMLYDLANANGVDDLEALILMGRAALNFVDLCGVKKARCLPLGGGVHGALGFREVDGVLSLDLEGYFDSKCGEKC